MMHLDYEQEVKQVLKLIKNKKMSPQEGKQKIEKLRYQKESSFSEGVAIIGMSGRFPGADNVSDFWDILSNGKSCITQVPKERWDHDTYYDPDVKNLKKTNSRFGGFINDIDKFDPLFFKISGMEAEVMDPQQRLFLEESYHALEQAGYANDKVSGEKCGVYVAAAPRDYLTHLEEKNIAGSAQAFWGNTGSILASRISYYLNLKGPAISLDTACSSSLVAVHLACQGILSGDVKMAVAGGAWICTTQHYYILTSNAGMLSPDGKCKTFDDRADGIVNGECVGAIVLKSLKDAVKDHDHILGVIKSSGINQDGKTNGITAPSSLSQTKLEMEVYDKADINPETISYIETHGTGTKLGDPIEVEALDRAFKQYTNRKHFCALGSVKTNIGHASLAAGIASVIKVLLALKYKKIPALLNFETLNEHIDLSQSAFYVNTALTDWEGFGQPLRAAVSSFGLGGTNAHLVIEEYTRNKQSDVKKMFYPITFSAKTSEALYHRIREFGIWLEEDGNISKLEDISYTLNVCRAHMEFRAGFVVENHQELKQKMDDFLKADAKYSKKTDDPKNNVELSKVLTELKSSSLSRQEYQEKVVCLMEYYLSGHTVEWEQLYKKEDCYKIPLPVYPFSKESYWISKIEKEEEVILSGNQLYSLMDENVIHSEASSGYRLNYYETRWVNQTDDLKKALTFHEPVLVFAYKTQDALLDEIRQRSENMVVIYPGDAYRYLGDNEYEIHKDNEKELSVVLNELKEQNLYPKKIIYLWTWKKFDINENTFAECAYSIFHLLKNLHALYSRELKEIKVLYQTEDGQINPYLEAIGAYSQSLGYLFPKLLFSTIHIIGSDISVNDVMTELYDKSAKKEVRYQNGTRWIQKTDAITLKKENENILKQNGVYLITGGAGGLGLLFARYLAVHYSARLILIGRSALSEEKKKIVEEFDEQGAKAVYYRADVSEPKQMAAVIKKAAEIFGPIQGVIHAAGIMSDKLIIQKEQKDFEQTVQAKIKGSVVLDEVTKEEPLDFFVLFSSTSSILGDFGQCDYSIGNRFLDSYAKHRNALVKKKQRNGKAITINWPLWQEGGMHVQRDTETLYLKTSVMGYLKTKDGLEAFRKIMESGKEQVMVLYGEKDRIDASMGIEKGELTHSVTEKFTQVDKSLPHCIQEDKPMAINFQSDIRKIAAAILKIRPEQMETDTNVAEYGFDSISLKVYADKISEQFQIELLPTVFFSENTIENLASYILNEYKEKIFNYYDKEKQEIKAVEVKGHKQQSDLKPLKEQMSSLQRIPIETRNVQQNKKYEPIAIIGVTGMLPGSKDLNEFWTNLMDSKDLITEIPSDRWDWHKFYSKDQAERNKSISNSGGFIRDVDKFDASFFNISRREAELMDPQQRLLLQSVWSTTEDAGYRACDLAGKDIGVFIGFQFSDYQELLMEIGEAKPQIATGNAHSLLANRISYFMNFMGPSESIDTACSSSLVAIHRAVKSIQSGESEMAFAGGVSLMLSPGAFLSASKLGILSPNNRCKTFDKDADGYVRGEGVGTLLLKPLSKAILDKDNIYAVIKGSALNHGGRANSLTAPNPDAQAKVLVKAYQEAEITPDTIGYIEAHGTGTELGDPIEIEGLKKAFKKLYNINGMTEQKVNYCGIGAVKTNIGHLEPAAGLAGIIKVIYALKQKEIPATIHLNNLNPYINLTDTPFYIVTEPTKWEKPRDQNGVELPRKAGVSSFGFGGANAHVVLEEYNQPLSENTKIEPQIIILSAKNQECLREYAINLFEFLAAKNDANNKPVHFLDLAYTLQFGREAMQWRLAIVASNQNELEQYLKAFIDGESEEGSPVYFNYKNIAKHTFDLFDQDDDAYAMISQWIEKKKLDKLAKLWVLGYEIDWNHLHKGETYFRISLPTYPFKKERFWLVKEGSERSRFQANEYGTLIDSLEFDLSMKEGIVFKKAMNNQLDMIRDHIINGKSVFPGVGYLEMVYQAACIVRKHKRISFKHIYWMKPLSLDEKECVVLVRISKKDEKLVFWISDEEEKKLYAKGELDENQSETQELEKVSIELIKSRCHKKVSSEEIYEQYARNGVSYGSFFKGIQDVYQNKEEALGEIHLTSGQDLNSYSLHPTLLDSALQVIGCLKESGNQVFVPFAVDKIEIFRPLQPEMYAYVRSSGHNRYHITILDENGNVCVRFNDYTLGEVTNISEKLYYEPVWEKKALTSKVEQRIEGKVGIVYTGDSECLAKRIAAKYEDAVEIKLGTCSGQSEGNQYELNVENASDISQLVNCLPPLNGIYFLGGIQKDSKNTNNYQAVAKKQEQGVISLFRFIKEIGNSSKFGGLGDLKIVTNNVYPVAGSNVVLPVAAQIIGFVKSFAKEYPKIRVTSVDLDLPDLYHTFSDEEFDALIQPIFMEESNENGETVVYRNNERYVRTLKPIKLTGNEKSVLKEHGIYMIIGGTGGIGIVLSKYLSHAYKANLILVGRSSLTMEQSERLMEIEKEGGKAYYYQADVTDADGIREVVSKVKHQFGRMNGVFHSAIVSKDKTIQTMSEDNFRAALDPKVIGSEVLFHILKEEPLDFMAFFSSTSSIAGMPGQCNYVSGLNFEDSFASYIQPRVSYPVKIFNWGYWGLGSSEDKEYGKYLKMQGIDKISVEEGIQTLEKVLNSSYHQVFILKAEESVYQKLGIYEVDEVPSQKNQIQMTTAETIIQERELTIKDTVGSEKDRLKEFLKDRIATLLKDEKDSIEDETLFSDMGIDSLLGLEFHANLEKSFGELPTSLLFEHTNVKSLVKYLLENKKEKVKEILMEPMKDNNRINMFSYRTKEQEELQKEESLGVLKEKPKNVDLPIELESFMVELDSGTKIEVSVKGTKDPVLIIPGFAVNSVIDIYQIRDLSEDYQVISINLPGHAKSDIIEDLSLKGMSRMMIQVMDKLNIIKPFHVIGGSFGGMIAQSIAKEFPERIKTLTLLGSFTLSKFEGVTKYFSFIETVSNDFEIVRKNTTSEEIKQNIDYCLNLYKISQETNTALLMKYLDLMKQGMTTSHILSQIKVPTLIMAGELDSVVDPQESKMIHEGIEYSRYIKLEDGGHFINLTHHKKVNQTIRGFLEQFDT
ncbi:SDR family NAD(P)-dependent oxidoreductase [Lachnotalea glycerini]|uniref:SDR family NAD(P)-dependent oxidoreductase n=1 Tax=Lachnotalea glycerini TaxID=1763509 RepID=A0A371JJJ7_9FIRM|nr:SDR family NAD(P)-dependent oxidoreductase [Lachnotalea glycerini]RDY32904.1 SDR family NAD(P)-dependent oxidoreductase [Lachnotalea glycerini]